jgi:hypothetical protein
MVSVGIEGGIEVGVEIKVGGEVWIVGVVWVVVVGEIGI